MVQFRVNKFAWALCFFGIAMGCADPRSNDPQSRAIKKNEAAGGSDQTSKQDQYPPDGTVDSGETSPTPSTGTTLPPPPNSLPGPPPPNSPPGPSSGTTPSNQSPPPPSVAVSSIDQGMQIIAAASSVNKPFKSQIKTYPSTLTVVDKFYEGYELNESTYSKKSWSTSFRGWQKDQNKRCKLVLEQEKAGELHHVIYRECGVVNRFGVVNCDNIEQLKFLGQKDIRSFKGAFGVQFRCSGKISSSTMPLYGIMHGQSYISRHEVWFHPDSNEPRKRVLEISSIGRALNQTRTVADMEKDSSTVTIAEYENSSAASSIAATLDTYTDFSVTGALMAPGTYEGEAFCRYIPGSTSILNSVTVSGLDLSVVSHSSQKLEWAFGLWRSNIPENCMSGGVGSYPLHNRDNINPNLGIRYPIDVTYAKVPNSPFMKVTVNGIITLNYAYNYCSNGIVHVTNLKPFYCIPKEYDHVKWALFPSAFLEY